MSLKRIVVMAVLVTASPCWAGERGTESPRADRVSDRDLATAATTDEQLNEPILVENRVFTAVPRSPMKKIPNSELVAPAQMGGSLMVKFTDDVRARCFEGKLRSLTQRDVSAADLIIRRYGLRIEPLFEQDAQTLARVEDKAAVFSGRGQPDLAGMMRVVGPRGRMMNAARAFNDLDIVEFVDFEDPAAPAAMQEVFACCLQPGGPNTAVTCMNLRITECLAAGGTPNDRGTCETSGCTGPCCYKDDLGGQRCVSGLTPIDCAAGVNLMDWDGVSIPVFGGYGYTCADDGGTICVTTGACCIEDAMGNQDCSMTPNVSLEDCITNGGRFIGAGILCDDDSAVCDPPGCGDDFAGSCYAPTATPASAGGSNSPSCDQQNCCQAVCQLEPECCDDNPNNPGDWTERCAEIAKQWFENGMINGCTGPLPPPVFACDTSGNSCYAPAVSAGCSLTSCCRAVCFQDPDCCDDDSAWDINCANLALLSCPTTVPTSTPDFESLQGYLTSLPWPQLFGNPPAPYGSVLVANLGTPPCNGDNTDTGFISGMSARPPHPPNSGFTGEGLDLAGLESVSGTLAFLGKGDVDMARGKGIRIGVIDQAAFIQSGFGLGIHEDLAGRVTMVPSDVTLLPAPITDPDHGTAVLGLIGANDDNDLGMVGVAPEAELYFFPAVTLENGGRISSAMLDVIDTFEPGDVLFVPFQNGGVPPGQPGSDGSCGTFASNATHWALIRLAVDAGITVVIPAGNNSCDLVESPQVGNAETNDCGAIVVGAITPGLPPHRIGASNHCTQCDDETGDNVHVAAWGAAVATLGYGDLYSGDLGPEDDYSFMFGYTSAAGAQIAGLVARYQGVSKQMYGIPFQPVQLRGSTDAATFERAPLHPDFIIDQDGGVALGVNDGDECLGDFSEQEDPNNIRGLPNALSGAAWIVAGDHFGQSAANLSGVQVLRGEVLYGNHFSLASQDQNYLTVESEYTRRDTPGASFDRASMAVRYLGSGQIADIIVDLAADPTILEEKLDVISVVSNTANPLTDTNLMITEMYDWNARKWDFVNFNFLTTADTQFTDPALFGVQRFIRSGDERVKVRLYTLGLGGSNSTGSTGGGSTKYIVRFDWVDLDIGQVTPPGLQSGFVE